MRAETEAKLLGIEAKLEEHPFPPQLVIENTSSCDQQCIHCSHKELQRPKRHMSRALWNKIVEEVGRESPSTEIWPTFYGEALVMGEEIWDRIDYAAQAGCANLVLNSNGGLLLRGDHIDRILNSPLKRFIISVDGYSKAVYEKVRYLGEWERTYGGIEELLRRKAASNKDYPLIICQFSLMEENEHEVEEFRKYWQERGAEVKVRPKLEWTATGSIRSEHIDHETSFRIACLGETIRWRFIKMGRWSLAQSITRGCLRWVMLVSFPLKSYGRVLANSFAVLTGNIVGRISRLFAKVVAIGKPLEPSMKKATRPGGGRFGIIPS